MTEIQFTTDELQMLVWALNSKFVEAKMADIKEDRPDSQGTKMLSDMCSRAYQSLVKALDEECERTAP